MQCVLQMSAGDAEQLHCDSTRVQTHASSALWFHCRSCWGFAHFRSLQHTPGRPPADTLVLFVCCVSAALFASQAVITQSSCLLRLHTCTSISWVHFTSLMWVSLQANGKLDGSMHQQEPDLHALGGDAGLANVAPSLTATGQESGHLPPDSSSSSSFEPTQALSVAASSQPTDHLSR